jgi:hypothetical protein
LKSSPKNAQTENIIWPNIWRVGILLFSGHLIASKSRRLPFPRFSFAENQPAA